MSLDEACSALRAYRWPDSTPAVTGPGAVDPFPEGGWVKTVDAAFADERISPEQYEAIWLAASGRGR